MSRFRMFDDPDGEILKHAHRFKLEIINDHEEGISLFYEVHGSVCQGPEDAPLLDRHEEADVDQVARDLLRRFLARAKGGAR